MEVFFIGHVGIAIPRANQLTVIALLHERRGTVSNLVDRHIDWALEQQQRKKSALESQNRQQHRLIRVIEKGLPRDA